MASYNLTAVVRALVVVAMAGIYIAAAESEHFEVSIINKLGEEEMNIAKCTYKSPLGMYSIDYDADVKWDLLISDDQPFECTLFWQNKYVEYPLFIRSKQGKRCQNNKCSWQLKPDGVYFMGEGSPDKGVRICEWKE